MKYKQKPKDLHDRPFRILLSKKEINLLLRVLYYEISYLKKNRNQESMMFQWQRYYKDSLYLLKVYSQPMEKEKKMFLHTVKTLDLLLGMLEVHLYDTLKDDFSIKLYERLSSIYKKRQKENLRISENKTM